MTVPELQSDVPARLLEHLAPRRDDMTTLLESLARAESPSTEPEAWRGAWDVLRTAMAERGFRARVFDNDGPGLLLARPASRARPRPFQLLLGHVDTVWPMGTLEGMPVEVDGDTIRGPGVYDMKAGLVQGLFAAEAVASVLPDAPVLPVFLINADEEIGSRGSTPYIRRLAARADRVYVLEPSLGPGGKLKTARKGIGRYTITVRGEAAHAGLDPDKGASAILELSHVVQALFALNDRAKGITVNVGMIDGGLRPNVVAPESRAVVDVRVPTSEEARRIDLAIRGLRAVTPGTGIDVEGGIGRPPMERTSGNRRLWTLAQRAAEALDLDLDQAAAGGGSDANTTSQYAPTLDGLGAVGSGAHARDESSRLDKMVERTALLGCLLSAPSMQGGGRP
jgi:glutamate carboxypeptidase